MPTKNTTRTTINPIEQNAIAFHDMTPIISDESPYRMSLYEHIEALVRDYFKNLKDENPTQLYNLMLGQLEKPLLSVVLEQTRGNQTRTAEILGLNRGTLRKKLKTYDLM